jgi:hypothetical protein
LLEARRGDAFAARGRAQEVIYANGYFYYA